MATFRCVGVAWSGAASSICGGASCGASFAIVVEGGAGVFRSFVAQWQTVPRLACRRMARQATLFGKAAIKEPFFKISSECSSYYRTINALWQLHPGNDRHEFFRAAQDKWSAKYKGNDDAVAALLERVELQGRSSTDGRRLMPSFLGATGRSSKEPVADAAGSAPISSTTGTASTDNTDVEVVLSVSGARKPLVLLCEA